MRSLIAASTPFKLFGEPYTRQDTEVVATLTVLSIVAASTVPVSYNLGKRCFQVCHPINLIVTGNDSVSLGRGESSSSRFHPKSIGFCLLISQKLHSGPVHLWKRRFSVDQSLSRSIYCSQIARNVN